ncbi:MAG: Ribulose-5-phosphate 4-epimerase and related epimerases and aldolases, partial [uncultured Acetobacteraceae bacterium]
GYPAHDRARGAAQLRSGQRGGAERPSRSRRVLPHGGAARAARGHLQPLLVRGAGQGRSVLGQSLRLGLFRGHRVQAADLRLRRQCGRWRRRAGGDRLPHPRPHPPSQAARQGGVPHAHAERDGAGDAGRAAAGLGGPDRAQVPRPHLGRRGLQRLGARLDRRRPHRREPRGRRRGVHEEPRRADRGGVGRRGLGRPLLPGAGVRGAAPRHGDGAAVEGRARSGGGQDGGADAGRGRRERPAAPRKCQAHPRGERAGLQRL